MNNSQNQILTENKVKNILKRMAFEIVENNYTESHLFLIGIKGQGVVMAQMLQDQLQSIRDELKITTITLSVDKTDPVHSEISLNKPLDDIKEGNLIIVDDVMNTGRTQAYAMSYLMQVTPRSVQTAVLVNRSHTSFPVSVTYSGIALSTTLDDHIEVRLEQDIGAYLS